MIFPSSICVLTATSNDRSLGIKIFVAGIARIAAVCHIFVALGDFILTCFAAINACLLGAIRWTD